AIIHRIYFYESTALWKKETPWQKGVRRTAMQRYGAASPLSATGHPGSDDIAALPALLAID
ncbi:MAG: hypothetical protein ACREXY_21445, partial [Gammaproteobacteria bacterium]